MRILLLLSLIVTSAIVAQARLQMTPALKKEKAELNARRSALTSQATHRRLSRAHTLMSDNIDQAIGTLERLLPRVKNRKGEKAQVLQTLGFAYAQKGDYPKAIKSFEDTLALKALPARPTLNTMYTLAQLHLAKDGIDKTIAIMEKWMLFADQKTPGAHVLLATAYAEKKMFQPALTEVNAAMKLKGEMKEAWLQLALALNYEMKKFKPARDILERLVTVAPQKAKYWKQLSGIYINLDDNKRALAAMEMAHKLKHLKTEKEILNLASLYMDQGVPLRAALVMEEGIAAKTIEKTDKNYEITSSAWLLARESKNAIKSLNLAAPLASSGNVFAQLGSLQLEKENWKSAENVLRKAIKKGKLRQPGQVRLGLGIALAQQQRFGDAIKQFKLAQKDKKSRRAAGQWISFVSKENQKVAGSTN